MTVTEDFVKDEVVDIETTEPVASISS